MIRHLWPHQAKGEHNTIADNLGHFATDTAASSHHHDAQDADHVPEGEHIAHMRAHEREELGAELTKGKLEWEKRQKENHLHTTTEKLGHLALETEASRHHADDIPGSRAASKARS